MAQWNKPGITPMSDPYTRWTTPEEEEALKKGVRLVKADKTFCQICNEHIEHRSKEQWEVHQAQCKNKQEKEMRERLLAEVEAKIAASKESKADMEARLRAEILAEIEAKEKKESSPSERSRKRGRGK